MLVSDRLKGILVTVHFSSFSRLSSRRRSFQRPCFHGIVEKEQTDERAPADEILAPDIDTIEKFAVHLVPRRFEQRR